MEVKLLNYSSSIMNAVGVNFNRSMFFVSGQPNRNDNYKKTIERANHYGYPINFYRIEPCCIVF